MQVQMGEIYSGKVTGVKKFGAFVRLECGVTGMVHISEVSNSYVQELGDVLSEGQEIKVKVVNVAQDGKVALSYKQAQENVQVEEPPRQRRPQQPRQQRADSGRVWQPKEPKPTSDLSFEDMMSRFKTQSEEKISDLRRVMEAHRGGGYSRRR